MALEEQIRQFIVDEILFGVDEFEGQKLTDDTSLSQWEVLNSTAILNILTFMEEELGVVPPDEDIFPENFDSVSRIADLARRYPAAS
jgi:acyl carrier protein